METSLIIFKENELKRRKAEEEIRRMVLSDPLTGITNLNQFKKHYKELSELWQREQKPLALLSIDLDDFKPINDVYGHAAGDLVLQTTAKHMLQTFIKTDVVARLGGDEFSVLLYAPVSIDTVISSTRRQIDVVPSPITFGEDMLSVNISVGVAFLDFDADSSSLMQHADKALYAAKSLGKNTCAVFY